MGKRNVKPEMKTTIEFGKNTPIIIRLIGSPSKSEKFDREGRKAIAQGVHGVAYVMNFEHNGWTVYIYPGANAQNVANDCNDILINTAAQWWLDRHPIKNL